MTTQEKIRGSPVRRKVCVDTPRAVYLGREAITPEIRRHLFEDFLCTSCSILNHSTDMREALTLACLARQSQAAIQAYVTAHSLHQTKEAPSESLFSAASIFPALGDKRNKFLAPRPTSQCAVERAMPPAPLTTNHDASGSEADFSCSASRSWKYMPWTTSPH